MAKFGVLLQTVPTPVMGGILILLFGSIAAVGMNILIKGKVDMSTQRNMVIVATTLVFGIGGMAVGSSEWHLQGVSLCALLAIFLNLVLPHPHPQPEADDLHEEQDIVEDILDHSR